ncbi:MAG: hypothetical protein AAFR35_01420 [Pseudomonadota bacterium]
MRALGFWAAAIVLAGCAEDGLVDRVARDQAKDAVRPVLEDNFPGVPVEPATDCVIDNARANEILELATASVTGVDTETAELVIDIATRPDTIDCLIEDGLPAIVRGLS